MSTSGTDVAGRLVIAYSMIFMKFACDIFGRDYREHDPFDLEGDCARID
jgi:hypothetical protein